MSNTVEEDNAHLSSKFRHMKYEISARHPVQGSSKKSKQENPDPSTLGTSSSYYNPRSDKGKTIVDTPQVHISDSCVKEQMKTRHRPTLKSGEEILVDEVGKVHETPTTHDILDIQHISFMKINLPTPSAQGTVLYMRVPLFM
ncbi:hypothetical protein AgCh_040240 [Apium graveolens]